MFVIRKKKAINKKFLSFTEFQCFRHSHSKFQVILFERLFLISQRFETVNPGTLTKGGGMINAKSVKSNIVCSVKKNMFNGINFELKIKPVVHTSFFCQFEIKFMNGYLITV